MALQSLQLANEQTTAAAGEILALACIAPGFSVETDKPFVLPFRDYPYGETKEYRGRQRSVLQRLDEVSARELAEFVNARAAEGKDVPIYVGHPDVPEFASQYPDKGAYGHFSKAEVDTEGKCLLLHPMWNEQPRKGAFKWFSPYWRGAVVGEENGTLICRPILMDSVGLTNKPKIYDFRLPNESAAGNKQENSMNREELIAFLNLDAAATDAQVKEALIALKKRAEDAEGKAEGLETEKTALANEKAAADTAKTETEVKLANERKAHAGVLIDFALAQGRATPATKAAWEKKLAEDFDKNVIALANEKPEMKTQSRTDALGRRDSDGRTKAQKIIDLVNEELPKHNGDRDAAYAAVKRNLKNKELFALAT